MQRPLKLHLWSFYEWREQIPKSGGHQENVRQQDEQNSEWSQSTTWSNATINYEGVAEMTSSKWLIQRSTREIRDCCLLDDVDSIIAQQQDERYNKNTKETIPKDPSIQQ